MKRLFSTNYLKINSKFVENSYKRLIKKFVGASISTNWLIKINYCHHRDSKRVTRHLFVVFLTFSMWIFLFLFKHLKNSHVDTQIKFNGNVKHGKMLWFSQNDYYSAIFIMIVWLFPCVLLVSSTIIECQLIRADCLHLRLIGNTKIEFFLDWKIVIIKSDWKYK